MFENLLGNDLLKIYLQSGALPQTLLFIGPDGIGKKQFALHLAAKLLNVSSLENHPDFHLLAPEGKGGVYAIDTVRHLIDKEHSAPFLASRKVFVLDSAERMQPASANALLKTLEEPSPDTQFILITSSPQDLLPTILSRCIPLTFQPLSDDHVAAILRQKGLKDSFAKMAQGSAARAIDLATNPHLEEQKNLLFSLLRKPVSYLEIADKTAKIEELIEKQEDPVLASQMVEHLFALILMWHRDQHARSLGVQELFFPEEPPGPLISLDVVEKKVAAALLATKRNLKLTACLEQVF